MEDSDWSKKPAKATEMENLSLDISISRNLLQRFVGGSSSSSSTTHKGTIREEEEEEDDDDEGIELNLGLSLGGKFGSDKKNLTRSSSIASCLPVTSTDDNDKAVPPPPAAQTGVGLMRTSSLPIETEDEWRKRKQVQSLRRMEAKRRRSEKQRSMRSESGGLIELNMRERLEREKLKRTSFGSSSNRAVPVSHGNVRGGGGSSSKENPSNSIEDMPCVFTKGDGPNGKRVDGILYKYCKGEQVRIMCICHGTFHSPSEFIVHAGGTDTDNPLKHIVVNPNSSAMI